MTDSTRVVTLLDSLRVGDIAKAVDVVKPFAMAYAAIYTVVTLMALVFIGVVWFRVLSRWRSR